MKKLSKLLLVLLVVSLCFATFAACKKKDNDPCSKGHKFSDEDGKCTVCGKLKCNVEGHTWVNAECKFCDAEYDLVDYVDQLKLDMNSETQKIQGRDILVRFVDGDTTHFRAAGFENDTLKARYLAVNTPESTGSVEPYGKVASNFTHQTLQDAIDNGGSLLVESDADHWESDSYNRTTAWVWYKPTADADWRNLNLELLQKGYGLASNARDNRYGEVCGAAADQALQARLIVNSGEPDETFFYGDAQPVTLSMLRSNIDEYKDEKVAFDGTVVMLNGVEGSYIEDYDPETGLSFGIYVYYGTVKQAQLLKILNVVGNRVHVVGTVTQFGGDTGTWQISGVSYRLSKPNDPGNCQLIEDYEGDPLEHSYQELTVPQFFGKTSVSFDDGEPQEYNTRELLLNASVSLSNLTVYDSYTTDNGGSNDGSITLYCQDAEGNRITVRTAVLTKQVDGTRVPVTEDEFEGATISVKGIVDYYADQNLYQVKVFRYSDITIVS